MGYEQSSMSKAIWTSVRHSWGWGLLGGLVALNVIVAIHAHEQRNTAKALVYAICQEARQEVSGASEQACGDAQDQLNIEYLCAQNNSLMSTHCWTEAK